MLNKLNFNELLLIHIFLSVEYKQKLNQYTQLLWLKITFNLAPKCTILKIANDEKKHTKLYLKDNSQFVSIFHRLPQILSQDSPSLPSLCPFNLRRLEKSVPPTSPGLQHCLGVLFFHNSQSRSS